MPKVKHLFVKSPNYLSDHSQVITWINLHQTTNTINNTPLQPPISKLPLQYILNNESNENFKKALKSDELQEKLSTFLENDFSSDREGINKCINEFQNIINLPSKKSLKIKKKKYRRKINNVIGLIKIVDLKDTSLENLQIINIEIQTILKSEVHTMLL
jgi:hypothetical protein